MLQWIVQVKGDTGHANEEGNEVGIEVSKSQCTTSRTANSFIILPVAFSNFLFLLSVAMQCLWSFLMKLAFTCGHFIVNKTRSIEGAHKLNSNQRWR